MVFENVRQDGAVGRMRYRPVGSEDDSRLSARVWYGRPPSSGANVTRASRGSTRSRATAQPRTGSTGDAHWPAVGAVSTVPWGAVRQVLGVSGITARNETVAARGMSPTSQCQPGD
jgi:hypothetical protein